MKRFARPPLHIHAQVTRRQVADTSSSALFSMSIRSLPPARNIRSSKRDCSHDINRKTERKTKLLTRSARDILVRIRTRGAQRAVVHTAEKKTSSRTGALSNTTLSLASPVALVYIQRVLGGQCHLCLVTSVLLQRRFRRCSPSGVRCCRTSGFVSRSSLNIQFLTHTKRLSSDFAVSASPQLHGFSSICELPLLAAAVAAAMTRVFLGSESGGIGVSFDSCCTANSPAARPFPLFF